tara:strand:+ start:85 stop:432 length:348 start_codon:yes stop_codon:yes gene_type:complete
MDKDNKELLEATVKGLQDKITSLENDLMTKQKELKDINKPEITGKIYDSLESCVIEGVQEGLGNLRTSDIDVEYGMEYDGKVYLESFNIPEDGLVEYIMGEINNKFKITEDEKTN